MVETTGIAAKIADELGALGLITSEQLAWACAQAQATGDSAGRIVLQREFVSEADVARVLEDSLGVPRVDLASYSPDEDAIALVPEAIARASRVVPLFEIDGVLTVAIGHASDVFDLDEVSSKIGLEVETVLAEPDAVDRALAQCYGTEAAVAEVEPQVAPAATPPAPDPLWAEAAALQETSESEEVPSAITQEPYTPAAIDLDVLAVADPRRTAMLVSDIIETAVARGATGIHVYPHLSDFLLDIRVDGRVEQLGQAPLSLQGALIDALRGFVHMPAGLGGPAVSRVQKEISGTRVTLAASAVQTRTGQRFVIGLEYDPAVPLAISELGMSDAETRAVSGFIERGRGLVIVASPIGEGSPSTYHALLAHAAGAGRSVLSVERGSGPALPNIAQVPVLPGSTPGVAAHIAAGLGQDTDVLAVETISSAEEAHLAVEAVRAGKLVVAGVVAAGTVAALRRLLDMGVEPVGLSAALAVVIGQRSTSAKPGSTVLFEILAITDTVRAAVAQAASVEELWASARKPDARPAFSSGSADGSHDAGVADEADFSVRAVG